MFYIQYMLSELRHRRGRTFLTALGLGVGVGLVVTVAALSDGLDKAQDEVLEPLTGVGTDLSVARPLELGGGGGFRPGGPGAPGGLSSEEQQQLQEENGGGRIGLENLGEPGEKFTRTDFVSMTQLSFPESEAGQMAADQGVARTAGGLTINAITVSGKVPEQTQDRFQAPVGGGGPPSDIDFDSISISGVDQSEPSLGAITEGQVSTGRYLSAGDSREAVLNVSYARRKDLAVGDSLDLKGRKFEIVGLAEPPLGGQASDVYMKLVALQRISGRENRVNTVYVRAAAAGDVDGLAKRIESNLEGAEVTTASDLADRVGGSLGDAQNLADKLGAALTIVGLVAAVMIASLLTLASVNKRVRELGTLKALGWTQRLVVRQVTGESLVQGLAGGVLGAGLGFGGAAIVSALAPELEASVTEASQVPGGPGAGPGPGVALFGQGQVASGSTNVTLDAPVDARLIALAVGLALLGALFAGAAGSLRASRLRPADALRHID